ncbi:hypothetical protein [Vibrio quintilis]|uniref:Uncharacterized protein n=1 Tax=Vibrio quintilis TaxID=1117707 RepID=A0A1M7Z2B8_9VIBR|nr:hypothetical protein [Vibrio quintilis]SHO58962.1 hypothetical protein VQ7734_04737 [Vibrio quintilis]
MKALEEAGAVYKDAPQVLLNYSFTQAQVSPSLGVTVDHQYQYSPQDANADRASAGMDAGYENIAQGFRDHYGLNVTAEQLKQGVNVTGSLMAAFSAVLGDKFVAADVQKLVKNSGVYQKLKGISDIEAGAQVNTAYHATNGAGVAQNILDGINPKFLNPDSRFGKAFYIGDSANTVTKELAHHNADSTHAIRYTINNEQAKVLDLTDPQVAKEWGYAGGEITDQTKLIGQKAQEQGFNVIKFNSERSDGVNLAVIGDFKEVLTPEIVVPTNSANSGVGSRGRIPQKSLGENKDSKAIGSGTVLAVTENRNLKQINESSGKYSTEIDDKVTVVQKDDGIPDWIQESFLDSNYRTVVTNQDITVYRVFGGNAKVQGAFVSTNPALNKIQAKIDAALLPEWKNTREFEAEIHVPKGTELNIGKVAPQTIDSTGTVLDGSSDQLLMPQNWSKEWIQNIRNVKP